MAKLSVADTSALYRLIVAEHEAKRAAADALEDFPSVAVFRHLTESANRHIATLCAALHSSGEKPPVLAMVPPVHHPTVVDALEETADQQGRMAAMYDELLQGGTSGELKHVVLPLWQSVSHLHLAAIADQLSIESGTRSEG